MNQKLLPPLDARVKGLFDPLRGWLTAASMTLAAGAIALTLSLPALAVPGRIVGDSPGSQVNVRSRPSTAAPAEHYGLVGDRIEIVDEATGSDGDRWYYVRFPGSGVEGWIRSDFVAQETTGQPTRWSHTYTCPDYTITLAQTQAGDYTYQARSPRGDLDLRNGVRRNSGYSWLYEFENGDTVYLLEDAWDSDRFPGGFAELRILQDGGTVLRQSCRK